MTTDKEDTVDVIIAGAGLAGLLVAIRLRQAYPDASLLILEKEREAGGRLRTPDGDYTRWGVGLHYVSQDLQEFFSRSFTHDDFGQADREDHDSIGILQGKDFREVPSQKLFSEETARILGGHAAAKQWKELSSLWEEESNSAALGKAINLGKKDPFWEVLDALSFPLGIVDIRETTVASLVARSRYFAKGLRVAAWKTGFDTLLKEHNLMLLCEHGLLEGTFAEGRWHLRTGKGSFISKALVVAQSPWESISWLQREHCPTSFLSLALKHAPVSLVTLSLRFKEPVTISSRILLPKDGVQVLKISERELCLQVIIDFETFLDAPGVVSAVKRLKRARKKLCQNLELGDVSDEFLALRPVGWAQDTRAGARKFVEGFDFAQLNQTHLAFCGDSYGPGYDPDQNLIKSLLAACSTISI